MTWELLTEWPKAEGSFLRIPHVVSEWAAVPWLAGYWNGVWALAIVPLAFWTAMWLVIRLFGDGASLSFTWRRMALPVAVVVAAGHMTKGLAKFVSWAGFLPGAIADPAGTETLRAMSSGVMAKPPSLLPPAFVIGSGCVLILGGLLFAIREARLAHPDSAPHASHLKIGIPSPEVLAPFVGVCEIACGLLLLAGFLTRLAAVPMIINMLVAISTTKVPILLKSGFWAAAHESRTDFSMLLGSLFLLIVGGGPWSFDARLTRRARA